MRFFSTFLFLLITVYPIYTQPIVELSGTEYDFGTVEKGMIIEKEIIDIKNNGDSDLILSAQTTCECLYISIGNKKLPPSQKTTIKIKFETEDYSGKIKKLFYLKTKGPKQSIIPLYIKGFIKGSTPKKQDTIIKQSSFKEQPLIQFSFFYAGDCASCWKLKNNFFPKTANEIIVNIEYREFDITEHSNYIKLISFKKAYGYNKDQIPIIFIGDDFLAGEKQIHNNFKNTLKKYKMENGVKYKNVQDAKLNKKDILDTLKFFAIITAGLLDGINPCAFATIVFLISYLAMLKREKKIILITGSCYTFSVFITYFLIGLGFFKALTILPAYHLIAKIINLVIALITFVLAILSLRDYFLARKGKTDEMSLQLSKSMKQKIHSQIRKKTKNTGIFISSILLGFTVSLFEFACTGQIYLPTITILLSVDKLLAIPYLVLYNIMFIIPLLIIFGLFYFGTSSNKMGNFLKRNIGILKLIMFLLFSSLGILLVLSVFLKY